MQHADDHDPTEQTMTPRIPRNRRSRARLLVVIASALGTALALAAHALAEPPPSAPAASKPVIPQPLLDQARSNPAKRFQVIVQSRKHAAPALATVNALTDDQRKALNDAARCAQGAARDALDLAARAATARDKADAAEAVALATAATAAAAPAATAARAQQAAAKARQNADRLAAAARAAQAAADAAREAARLAQLSVAAAQGELAFRADAAGDAIDRTFVSIPAVSATLTGSEIVTLSSRSDISAVTPDAAVTATGNPDNSQL